MTEGLVLIDTSVWISAFRPRTSKKAREQVGRMLDEDRVATCGIVIAELLSGTRSRTEYRELSADLNALHYLTTPESVWQKVSELGYKLRTKGLHVPIADLLIAQVAIDNDCTLLHMDSHFDLIGRNSPLKAETVKRH
jgi:predicted nucleic acid-binding protein